MASWFEVDRVGMARVLERRGKSAALLELVQNGWDEAGVTRVSVKLEPVPGKPLARFSVEDDAPEGFLSLGLAYTLFAPSAKAANPEQRGRFAIGEKLVLAICVEAEVETTKGSILFAKDGTRSEHPRRKREAGSVIRGTLRMTREEIEEALASLRHLIPPQGIATTINGEPLIEREPLAVFKAPLDTEVADEDGYLRRRFRTTEVAIHEPLGNEVAALYEMGIPVVETGDRWHVDVRQKVPVTLDRKNLVSAAYLRDLRAEVLDAMADRLDAETAAQSWVTDALDDPLVTDVAVTRALDLRYGEKRVIYDPSDHEANRIAASKGYAIIHGGALSSDAWANVRKHEAALPAGQVTPSPKPFSPDGTPLKVIDPADYSDDHEWLAQYAEALHMRLIGTRISVILTDDPGWDFKGAYGENRLTLNVLMLSFADGQNEQLNDLLIHEFAHYYGGHLDADFDTGLSRLGAKMVALALDEPEFFDREEQQR